MTKKLKKVGIVSCSGEAIVEARFHALPHDVF